MCAVSMISVPYKNPEMWPNWPTGMPFPQVTPNPLKPMTIEQPISRFEFDLLRKDVEELKKLLEAARAEDIANGEPDCEMEDKVAIIKQIAKLVGVDLSEVFPNDGT